MSDWTDIALVLVLGAGIGAMSVRFRFPNAVAQVVLGVVLGTALLGWVPHSPLLHGFGEVGVVLLLGVAGLELGFERLRAAGWAGGAVAALGIILSVAGGYAIGVIFGSPSDEALYLGLALGATSIGITVQVLEQFGLIGHRVADIVIAAAVIDDVIALYLLGAAHGFLVGGFSVPEVVGFVLLALGVLGGLFFICRGLTRWLDHHGVLSNRWIRSVWILTSVGVGAWLTHALDLSSVVGAFFAGVGTGEGLKEEVSERSARLLQPLVLVFMPFFFVMIGVQAQWDILEQPTMLWLVIVLVLFAVLSKALGGLIGAFDVASWRDRWIIGLGMVARGEVGLIIATLGFTQGHITHPVFVALVLTTIVVSAIGPLLMAPLAKRLSTELALGASR